jgi:hypothetical protein
MIKYVLASLKSMKKRVGTGVGSGSASISQRYGSGDPDPDQNVNGSPTLPFSISKDVFKGTSHQIEIE